jgi:hypothetical protein
MTVDTPTLLNPPISRRTFEFSRLVRTVGYVAVVSAMAVAVGTFFILMGLTPIAPTEAVVLTVLILSGALAAVLVLVIGWEIGSLVHGEATDDHGEGEHEDADREPDPESHPVAARRLLPEPRALRGTVLLAVGGIGSRVVRQDPVHGHRS